MTKWQYLNRTINLANEPCNRSDDALNRLGDEGWEVVGSNRDRWLADYLLKRPKPEDKVIASYSHGTPSHKPETVTLLIGANMSVGGKLVPMVCTIDGVHLRWIPYEMGVPAAADNDLPVQVVTMEIAQIGGRNSWMKQRCIP